jgi:hypothetical protein
MTKQFVFDPNSSGVKISSNHKAEVIGRIHKYAGKNLAKDI